MVRGSDTKSVGARTQITERYTVDPGMVTNPFITQFINHVLVANAFRIIKIQS